MTEGPRSIQPHGWPRPRGYSNGMAARGELLAVAGMIGWDAQERLVSDEFVPQFRQALANVCDVVRAAGGQPQHILSLTIYVTDKHAYIAALREVGEAYRALLGKHYPAMALVQVAALLEDRAKVEIQALAALPGSSSSSSFSSSGAP
jgi:enamine deaminase RidA (YjgF/YER057c/UK114 family)